MRVFQNMSIRRKQTLIIMLTGWKKRTRRVKRLKRAEGTKGEGATFYFTLCQATRKSIEAIHECPDRR